MSGTSFTPKLACPNCGKSMRFVRAIPGIGALPELWTFECMACTAVMTESKEEVLKPESAKARATAAAR